MGFRGSQVNEPRDDLMPAGLVQIVDTVGADIYARLVTDWLRECDDESNVDRAIAFQKMANDALGASFVWGLRRHQACEPCADRETRGPNE